jgi:pyridoxine 5'-phosphate synthase PdxJ
MKEVANKSDIPSNILDSLIKILTDAANLSCLLSDVRTHTSQKLRPTFVRYIPEQTNELLNLSHHSLKRKRSLAFQGLSLTLAEFSQLLMPLKPL